MFSDRENPSDSNGRVSGLPTAVFLYLGAEVLVTALIGILLGVLALVKRVLPKPPRDIKNDKVVITGAGSGLGKAVADEFFEAGCSVACIDEDIDNSQQITNSNSPTQYERLQELDRQNDAYLVSRTRAKFYYKCNTSNRAEVLDVAKKIHKDIGHVNILISCAGNSSQNIADIASTSLMSHYWTMLAFIPSMLRGKHGHVVAVIPATSTDDAYMGSKAAVAGLIEAIGQQLSNANHMTFTTVAPRAEPRLMKQSEEQTARDIVEAVRRDQRTLTTSWGSGVMYTACCMVHRTITSFTDWLYRQGCDEST